MNRRGQGILLSAFLLLICGKNSQVHGQSRAELDQRLKAIEKKLQQMEGLSKKSSPTPTPQAKTDSLTSERGGIVLTAPAGGYTLKLGGFVQADSRNFIENGRTFGMNNFLVRRARLDFQPSFDKTVGFKVQGDFAGTAAVLKDGYAWVKFIPNLQLLAGKFKPPTSLDRLQGDSDQVFIEKNLASNLTPDRDLGAMLTAKMGDFGTGALAVCNGAPDNGSLDLDTDNAKTWTGRIFFIPFAKMGSFVDGLGIGAAGSFGTEYGATPAYVTSGQLTFFSLKSSVKTQGDRYRLCPQGSFYWGPVGLEGEYLLSDYGLVNGAATGTVLQKAWQGTASFVFGGKAAYAGALPDKPFDLSKGQLGALELGVRASELDLDPATFSGGFADPNSSAQQAFSFGGGVNWVPEPRFKLSLNYEWTQFQGGAAGGANRLPEEVFLTRVQSFF